MIYVGGKRATMGAVRASVLGALDPGATYEPGPAQCGFLSCWWWPLVGLGTGVAVAAVVAYGVRRARRTT